MRTSFQKNCCLLLLISTLISCEQELPLENISNQIQVNVEDDHLVIRNSEDFNSLIIKANPYSKFEYDGEGFTSLMDIYQQAVAEETKYFEILESYSEEELQNLFPNGVSPHCDFVNKNAHFFNFDDEGWFELKIADLRAARFVNSDGIIKVDNTFRKYTAHEVFFGSDVSVLKSINELSNLKTLPKGVIRHTYEKIRIEHSEARIISSSFQVNACTDRKDRYRVRLYEDILVANKGNGSYEMLYGFSVHSFRHTVQGWQRRFATGALAGRVDYQASFGFDGYTIQANGTQESLGWTFVSGYTFTDFNRPEIFYSQGQGWGRNDCYCTYTGNY